MSDELIRRLRVAPHVATIGPLSSMYEAAVSPQKALLVCPQAGAKE